jgi:hypothetical protein
MGVSESTALTGVSEGRAAPWASRRGAHDAGGVRDEPRRGRQAVVDGMGCTRRTETARILRTESAQLQRQGGGNALRPAPRLILAHGMSG